MSASTGLAEPVLMDAAEWFEVRTDRAALRQYIRRMSAIAVSAYPIPRHPRGCARLAAILLPDKPRRSPGRSTRPPQSATLPGPWPLSAN
jgi:hypothetical protein